jgi:hypothetical protein
MDRGTYRSTCPCFSLQLQVHDSFQEHFMRIDHFIGTLQAFQFQSCVDAEVLAAQLELDLFLIP